VVKKETFLNSGGYDEKYDAWGPDDKDFNARLRRMGYSGVEIDAQYLNVVLHNDKMRFREYRHAASSTSEDHQLLSKSETTIANFGRFGNGVVFKNFNLTTPIWLTSLPTRIFGIGMHKTATTSLHTALTKLGYDSAHWKTAHWAKAIWTEINETGKSHTLEKSYALCDFPITILYKQLDDAYPGSKFILTIRDEDRWLRSVENHWSPEHNPFRKAWDTDPFTHKIHTEVYGRRKFDADVMRARYRRHNAEVREYFKNRPNDLLVMDMESPGWEKLCCFLKQPIPDSDYPLEFPTRARGVDAP
jgi:hypothetical protein